MKDKFLNFICVAFALAFSGPAEAVGSSLYQHELIGQCFNALDEARRPFRLSDGTDDENIRTSQAKFDKKSTWVIDKTSSHNFQWYLVEKGDRGYCYVLYIPFAAEVSGSRTGDNLTIRAKTQPSPGTKSYQMIFRKAKKSGNFVPYQCSEIRDQTKANTKPRVVDCLSVGKE